MSLCREGKMVKGYFFSYFNINDFRDGYEGIKSKIRMQLEIFSEISEIHFICNRSNYLYIHKFISRIPWTKTNCDWKFSPEYAKADYIYIRKIAIDRPMIQFIKKVKNWNPQIIILLEFPNFPYDKEFIGIRNKLYLLKEKIYRRLLKRYVDRIVVYCPSQSVFGVKTIQTRNGIDFSKIEIAKNCLDPSAIRIIGVANLHYTHGFDRFIYGLYEYYRTDETHMKIIFTIVGMGSHYHYLKSLVIKLKLEEFVIFKGTKTGRDLDYAYENQDIAIESLGACRQDINVSSSLKSREYMAKGLPMITDIWIDVIPENYDYVLMVPKDETPIDIKSVIDFYHRVYDDSCVDAIKQEIRELGLETCDIRKTMKPIVDYIIEKGKSGDERYED